MELVGGEWAPGGRARILLWAELATGPVLLL